MSSCTKLKPCPFCGGEAKLLIVGKRPNGDEEWYVSCNSENCSLYPHSTIPYTSAEIAAAAWNRRAENTRSAPVGDKAAMREVVMALAAVILPPRDKAEEDGWLAWIRAMQGKARAALAKPPRNCDMGAPEEQEKRFNRFCGARHLPRREIGFYCAYKCPVEGETSCELQWAQMPYTESEATDGK